MPKVAIIIVNYNGQEYLHDCLSSLLSLDYPQELYKIILVDNASSDNSVEFVKNNFPQVEIIVNQQNLGFAQGNNVAMAKALQRDFDYILLINQDTISQPDFLSKIIKVAEADEKIAAVQPRLMLHPQTDKVNSLGNAIHYLGFGYSLGANQPLSGDLQSFEIAYASGAALLMKSEVLKQIGLFDPDFFMYHEDLDLGWRMRMAGYKIMVVPESVVYHKYEFSRSVKKYYYMERNRYICILENYKWLSILLITPACLVMELGLFLFSLKSGFWQEKIRGYLYFLKPQSWQKIFQHRQEKKKYRQVKDKQVIKYFTGKITNQEIDNWLLDKIANPIFNLYWQIIKKLIIW
ncbi:MAG: glycosyltransferase [Candidatus Buchananbacteria bacterium]|nr:glycosyltransferase [Candidatus Buchananbacteria bacterium]